MIINFRKTTNLLILQNHGVKNQVSDRPSMKPYINPIDNLWSNCCVILMKEVNFTVIKKQLNIYEPFDIQADKKYKFSE